MTTATQKFLSLVDEATKNDILKSIANHYGITQEDAYDEVTDVEAEHLLDYMVEPQRAATSLLMKRHGV